MADSDLISCPLIQFNARGRARRRLFCLPFAGGGPATFRLWPDSLPDDVEVVVVMSPGRDPRRRTAHDVPPGTMTDLLPPALDAISELQTDSPLPFAVFGHSMGALIAYELTIEFERRSEQSGVASLTPDHLFVSGRRPADELHNGPRIHDLADDEFIEAMQQNYGGVPDLVRNEPELLALFLPGLRADVKVFETYSLLNDRQVICPVRVYGGDDDRGPRPELLPGWQRLANRTITVRTFAGDHFYLNDARSELCADLGAQWNGVATGSMKNRRTQDSS